MKNHLDEYTQRKLRSKKSRVTPERVPIHSGVNPDNLRSESGVTPDKLPSVSGHTPDQSTDTVKKHEETTESERKKDAAVAADLRLKEKAEGCWKPLGISPCGLVEFQEIWQRIWEDRKESEKLSYPMERCIQVCERESVDVKIPSAFRRAWERIADAELWEEMQPFYDEAAKVLR